MWAVAGTGKAKPRQTGRKISKRTKLNWTFIKRFLLMPQVPARANTSTNTNTNTHDGAPQPTGDKVKWQERQMRAIIVLSVKFYWQAES